MQVEQHKVRLEFDEGLLRLGRIGQAFDLYVVAGQEPAQDLDVVLVVVHDQYSVHGVAPRGWRVGELGGPRKIVTFHSLTGRRGPTT